MSSGALERAAANVTLPTRTYSDAFAATAVNTGGLDLGAVATGVSLVGSWVWIKADAKCSLRASDVAISTANGNIATVGDMKLEANVDYSARINKATRYVSVFGGASAGTLFVAAASGPPA